MLFDDRRSRIPNRTNINDPSGLVNSKYGISLGDSVTMGWGISGDETYSAVLGDKVGFPVINLGVSSYNTYRELDKGISSGLVKNAAFVVIQYHVNDSEENSSVVNDGPKRYAYKDYENRIKGVKQTYGNHTGGYRPFDYVSQLLYMAWNRQIGRVTNASSRDLESEARNFFKIIDMWPEYKDKLIIVFDGSEYSYQDLQFSKVFDGFAKSHGYKNVKAIDVHYVKDGYFFLDNHQNPLGHMNIADGLYADVKFLAK